MTSFLVWLQTKWHMPISIIYLSVINYIDCSFCQPKRKKYKFFKSHQHDRAIKNEYSRKLKWEIRNQCWFCRWQLLLPSVWGIHTKNRISSCSVCFLFMICLVTLKWNHQFKDNFMCNIQNWVHFLYLKIFRSFILFHSSSSSSYSYSYSTK